MIKLEGIEIATAQNAKKQSSIKYKIDSAGNRFIDPVDLLADESIRESRMKTSQAFVTFRNTVARTTGSKKT